MVLAELIADLLPPGVLNVVTGQGQLNILFSTAGRLGELFAGNRGDVLEVLAFGGGNPFPADPVLVPGLELDLGTFLAGL
jgi:hypothetical protein